MKILRDMAATGIVLGESMGYDRLRELVTLSRGESKGGGGTGDHSPFMNIYAYKARQHMQRYGSTAHQLAVIASKNHQHSTHNDRAQYNFALSRRRAETVAAELQQAVFDATGLTCSIGVTPNKLLSKIASDLEKPGGLTVLSAPIEIPSVGFMQGQRRE